MSQSWCVVEYSGCTPEPGEKFGWVDGVERVLGTFDEAEAKRLADMLGPRDRSEFGAGFEAFPLEGLTR